MITFNHKGSFKNTEKLLKDNKREKRIRKILDKYGERGVRALAEATPKDTGKTAASWGYTIEAESHGVSKIVFTNSNVNKYVNIAIILQYGHATGTGGYVAGRDYINPAIQPVFDDMAASAWKEVTGT